MREKQEREVILLFSPHRQCKTNNCKITFCTVYKRAPKCEETYKYIYFENNVMNFPDPTI
jgi:uncharacterized protein YcgL (UPF0745 family)